MYEYLKSYKAWVTNGAPNAAPYQRDYGLHFNLSFYSSDVTVINKLEKELDLLFEKEGLDSEYPFGMDNYFTRNKNLTQHIDPLRTRWINKNIKNYTHSKKEIKMYYKNTVNPSLTELSFREILKDQVPPFNDPRQRKALLNAIRNISYHGGYETKNIFDDSQVSHHQKCKVISDLNKGKVLVIPLLSGVYNDVARLGISQLDAFDKSPKIFLEFIPNGTKQWSSVLLSPVNIKNVIDTILY